MTDSEEISQLRAELDALKKTVATTLSWSLSAYEFSMVVASLHPEKKTAQMLLKTIGDTIDASNLFTTATDAQLEEISAARARIADMLREKS